MNIGLTGGMGCGKSTVAKLFGEGGFRVIDSDRIVRDELLVRPETIDLLLSRWGRSILMKDGLLNRVRIAEIIFDDDIERNWLESYLHPLVKMRWEAAFASGVSSDWVVEVPLLFEKGLEKGFDFTVCVSASYEIQLTRLKERGILQTLAEQRISKQLPLAQKQDLADFVIFNDGSSEFLHRQVRQVISIVRSSASRD